MNTCTYSIPNILYQQKVDVEKKTRIEIISTTENSFTQALFSKIILNFTYVPQDLHYAVFPSKMFLCLCTRTRSAYIFSTLLFAIKNFHKYNKVNKRTKI